MFKFELAIAAIAASLLTVPAAAQDSNSSRLEKADKAARTATSKIYGAAGRSVCGRSCGKVASKVGVGIYDGAQDLSRRGAAKMQEVGRKARERRQRGRND